MTFNLVERRGRSA